MSKKWNSQCRQLLLITKPSFLIFLYSILLLLYRLQTLLFLIAFSMQWSYIPFFLRLLFEILPVNTHQTVWLLFEFLSHYSFIIIYYISRLIVKGRISRGRYPSWWSVWSEVWSNKKKSHYPSWKHLRKYNIEMNGQSQSWHHQILA